MNKPPRLHDFFVELPVSVQKKFDPVSTTVKLDVGETIMKSHKQPTAVYQILSGQVKYFSSNADGRGKVLVIMGKGDWIGLSELFIQLPSPWDVSTITPTTLRKISYENFDKLIDNDPIIAKKLLKNFSLRFRFFNLFDLDHSSITLKDRVIKVLYLISTSFDNGNSAAMRITLEISQEDLSMVVGASRQKTNQALKEIQQEGTLEIQYGSIILCDRGKLRIDHKHLFEALPFL